jgi:hypothetical protein
MYLNREKAIFDLLYLISLLSCFILMLVSFLELIPQRVGAYGWLVAGVGVASTRYLGWVIDNQNRTIIILQRTLREGLCPDEKA